MSIFDFKGKEVSLFSIERKNKKYKIVTKFVSTDGTLNTFDGWTNKFIFPPYDFSIANCMITNFHTPLSTLLMLISAFCGHDLMMEAYHTALKEKYRFYSYGDAMLII